MIAQSDRTNGRAPTLPSRRARAFERLDREWTALGLTAREWAIRQVPGAPTAGGAIDKFLLTGRYEVDLVAARARDLGVPFGGTEVLDFGCGPGRMSQALTQYFDAVIGVDVSPAMIDLAREINRLPTRCRFLRFAFPDLREFPSGTFASTFSVYVLQHMPQWLIRRYISELVRVTRPGGSIVFQLHGRVKHWIGSLVPEPVLAFAYNRWARRRRAPLGSPGTWEVHWMAPRRVGRALEALGAELRAVDRVPRPDGRLISFWYYAIRRKASLPDVSESGGYRRNSQSL